MKFSIALIFVLATSCGTNEDSRIQEEPTARKTALTDSGESIEFSLGNRRNRRRHLRNKEIDAALDPDGLGNPSIDPGATETPERAAPEPELPTLTEVPGFPECFDAAVCALIGTHPTINLGLSEYPNLGEQIEAAAEILLEHGMDLAMAEVMHTTEEAAAAIQAIAEAGEDMLIHIISENEGNHVVPALVDAAGHVSFPLGNPFNYDPEPIGYLIDIITRVATDSDPDPAIIDEEGSISGE